MGFNLYNQPYMNTHTQTHTHAYTHIYIYIYSTHIYSSACKVGFIS